MLTLHRFRMALASFAIVLALILFSPGTFAQTLNGNAFVQPNGCVLLTNSSPWQSGSIYYPDTLNLNRPFDFLMHMNFGSRDLDGADGMVFILQNTNPSFLGPAGGSLGWFGLSNSIGVEIDTYENIPESDPSFDHIAIFRDGGIDHALPSNLAGPVLASPFVANIEDGNDFIFQITWDPVTTELDVYFDCAHRLSLTIDLVDSIFGGDSLVHWGVSAAGGGAFNQHTFCFPSRETGARDTIYLCEGDSTFLNAGPSRDSNYVWAPNYNLSGTTGPIVEAWPLQDTFYTVSYIDVCGLNATDTIVFLVAPPQTTSLVEDTLVCGGGNHVINPGLTNATFNWSNGWSTSSISVTADGLYSYTATDLYGCEYADSQMVEFQALPAPNLGADLALCGGSDSTFVISAGTDTTGTDFVWSTGETTDQIMVDTTGIYIVEASNRCGTVSDTVEVGLFPDPDLDLGNDTTGCNGDEISIDPGIDAGTFAWSNGSNGNVLTVDSTGSYSLIYTDTNGCQVHDTLLIEFFDPPIVITDEDKIFCGPVEPYTLTVRPIFSDIDYVWSTGDSTQELTVNSTGEYIIYAINGCSTATDTVNMTFYRYEEGYFIPNVFSPNDDGINDVFLVENFLPEAFQLQIYDRWGNLTFETRDHNQGWDGRISGKPAPAGTYYYWIRTQDCNGRVVREKGYLTLVR